MKSNEDKTYYLKDGVIYDESFSGMEGAEEKTWEEVLSIISSEQEVSDDESE